MGLWAQFQHFSNSMYVCCKPHQLLIFHWITSPSATDWYTLSVWRRGITGPSFLLLSDCTTSTAPYRPHPVLCTVQSLCTNSFHHPYLLYIFKICIYKWLSILALYHVSMSILVYSMSNSCIITCIYIDSVIFSFLLNILSILSCLFLLFISHCLFCYCSILDIFWHCCDKQISQSAGH